MNMNVTFSEPIKTDMAVAFSETGSDVDVDFGNVQVVNIGLSAYEVAVKNGFEGTEEEWLESLEGEDGRDGYTPVKGVDYFDGKDGYTPVKGVDYFDGQNGKDGYTPVKGVDYFDGQDGQPGEDAAFIAVQNQTTFDEVMAAIEQGKAVFARSGKNYYILTNYETSLIRFSRAYQSTTSHITLNTSDKWAAGSTTHAKSSHTHTSDDVTFTDETIDLLVEAVLNKLPVYDGEVETE